MTKPIFTRNLVLPGNPTAQPPSRIRDHFAKALNRKQTDPDTPYERLRKELAPRLDLGKAAEWYEDAKGLPPAECATLLSYAMAEIEGWRDQRNKWFLRNIKKVQEKSEHGKRAIDARHSKDGGSRAQAAMVKDGWASGRWGNRELCAEAFAKNLGKSYSSMRKHLNGTPDPSPTTGWKPTRRPRIT